VVKMAYDDGSTAGVRDDDNNGVLVPLPLRLLSLPPPPLPPDFIRLAREAVRTVESSKAR